MAIFVFGCLLASCLITSGLGDSESPLKLNIHKTVDVTVSCDLSAFLRQFPHKKDDNIPMRSVQVVRYAREKEHILATLDSGNQRWPSEFLKSLGTFFTLNADVGRGSLEKAWLTLTFEEKSTSLKGGISYHCKVAFDSTSVPDEDHGSRGKHTKFWNSEIVPFTTGNPVTHHPGIHVTVSIGLTVECMIRSQHDHSMADHTFIRRRLEADGESRYLCEGSNLSDDGPSRLKCNFTEVKVGAGMFVIRQAHLFNISCQDKGAYVCATTHPEPLSSEQESLFPNCSTTSDERSTVPTEVNTLPPTTDERSTVLTEDSTPPTTTDERSTVPTEDNTLPPTTDVHTTSHWDRIWYRKVATTNDQIVAVICFSILFASFFVTVFLCKRNRASTRDKNEKSQ